MLAIPSIFSDVTRIDDIIHSMSLEVIAGMQQVSKLPENTLRYELISCLLGSQVTDETAKILVRALNSAGLLSVDNDMDVGSEIFAKVAAELISGKSEYCQTSHRFPNAKARQFVGTRRQMSRISLTSLVYGNESGVMLRNRLVELFPGIGPKQASLFLRNIGHSLDLAVLDVHVLRYCVYRGLLSENTCNLRSDRDYARIEVIFARYAESLGFVAGVVDTAVWALMRVVPRPA